MKTTVPAASKECQKPLKRETPLVVGSVLLSVVVVLLIAHIWSGFSLPLESPWSRQLNLNNEGTIGTVFAASLLASCAIILRKITSLKKGGRFGNHWRMLGFIFFYLAADELLKGHEQVDKFLRANIETSGIFHYPWVIPGSLVVLAIALIYRRFVAHLPPATRKRFYLAGGLYISGVLGMEMMTGYYISRYGKNPLGAIVVLNGIEETLEMLGAVFFIYTLLVYLQSLTSQARRIEA